MRNLTLFFFYLFCVKSFGQDFTLTEKFELPNQVEETSGLLYYNNKIITHNDSGNDANLYEIDPENGEITRVVTVANATNIDWEDLGQDDTYIYIADIGNNNGNREDLKIYKILKSDFISSTNVTSQEITFSYEDQTDFSSQPNNSNFDAEAICVYQDQILIFTKNWLDFKTNTYVIPTDLGDYSAEKVSSYDSQGLITGVSYNSISDSFLFCGYDSLLTPFLLYLDQNRPPSLDVFGGDPQRIDLVNSIFLEQGSQIEGITFFEESRYYISREYFSTEIANITFEFPQKLHEFYNPLDDSLSTSENKFSESINIVPNPAENFFEIIQKNNFEIFSVKLYSLNGQYFPNNKQFNKIYINDLSKGIYFLKILFKNGKTVVKKIVRK